jgi:hypothetical protein
MPLARAVVTYCLFKFVEQAARRDADQSAALVMKHHEGIQSFASISELSKRPGNIPKSGDI